jgi:hypothetical protein
MVYQTAKLSKSFYWTKTQTRHWMEQSWWNQKCVAQWNAFTCRLRLWIQKMA